MTTPREKCELQKEATELEDHDCTESAYQSEAIMRDASMSRLDAERAGIDLEIVVMGNTDYNAGCALWGQGEALRKEAKEFHQHADQLYDEAVGKDPMEQEYDAEGEPIGDWDVDRAAADSLFNQARGKFQSAKFKLHAAGVKYNYSISPLQSAEQYWRELVD